MDLVASPTAVAPTPAPSEPFAESTAAVRNESDSSSNRPSLVTYVSSPAYSSPRRHHHRHPSTPRQVKESLHARSEYITSQDDGVAEHRINQYIIKHEIGRGSFGAVHLAVDQYGKEYAVKEFSKSRLRKRAQSHLLRKPWAQRRQGALAARQSFNSPLHRNPGGDVENGENPVHAIDLIKEEIAIMKKLNHENVVALIEVLDDPSEDSLYMVMEMCKKGVVMKVGLEERCDPYPDGLCRFWFRDLLLGVEYLHAQGVVHRDIKPDNCLITEDDTLKVMDFGVSEMFEKNSEMVTAKSAGSPAFLPPELCIARHGDISGKAVDIWSMGVTLYCLRYGRIPFEKTGIFDLYESIKSDEPDLSTEKDEDFKDLICRILEKDPAKRIKMPELRNHPWVTKQGTDPLLSEEENTANMVDPPTEAEMNAAITRNMKNLMTVVKAVNKFKNLTAKKRQQTTLQSILEPSDSGRFFSPPSAMHKDTPPLPGHVQKSYSLDTFDRHLVEGPLAAEGIHREIDVSHRDSQKPTGNIRQDADQKLSEKLNTKDERPRLTTQQGSESDGVLSGFDSPAETPLGFPDKLPPFRANRPYAATTDEVGHRGHAHNPLEDQLYLFIGPSTFAGPQYNPDRRLSFIPDEDDVPIVSESPGAADVDIYETAYRDEIERIKARATEQQKEEPAVYLTRRVDAKLLALSGKAGRWAAVGEEGLGRIRDYTQFRERKAKVTEVSRALREAAKEEYTRKKQERKDQIEAYREEKAKGKEIESPKPSADSDSQTEGPVSTSPASGSDMQPVSRTSSSQWTGKARDKGRQAKTSLLGFVDLMKTKSKPSKGDNEGE